jgi:hypothetical protein
MSLNNICTLAPELGALGFVELHLPAPVVPGFVVFVVAAPQGDAGVLAQAFDLFVGLGGGIFQNLPLPGYKAQAYMKSCQTRMPRASQSW